MCRFSGSDGLVAYGEVYEDLLKAGVVDPAKVESDTHRTTRVLRWLMLRHGYVTVTLVHSG